MEAMQLKVANANFRFITGKAPLLTAIIIKPNTGDVKVLFRKQSQQLKYCAKTENQIPVVGHFALDKIEIKGYSIYKEEEQICIVIFY